MRRSHVPILHQAYDGRGDRWDEQTTIAHAEKSSFQSMLIVSARRRRYPAKALGVLPDAPWWALSSFKRLNILASRAGKVVFVSWIALCSANAGDVICRSISCASFCALASEMRCKRQAPRAWAAAVVKPETTA